MRKDHRPYSVKRLQRALERAYVEHFLRPQLDGLGEHHLVMKPWNLRINGACIRFGENPHVITTRDRPVTLTTWAFGEHQGSIEIGDYCLLCPGTRLDSASSIVIGNNSMLAANAYVTDADWHDIYDRAAPIGRTVPVTLGDNVWIGDSAIVCKGVTIGDNTVVGTGSVVTRDLPANVIAAGTPARVIRELDAARPLRRRIDALADADAVAREVDAIERYALGGNGWLDWFTSLFRPRPGD